MIHQLITDVDGVMTDGKFFYTESGKIMKQFGPHDNDGIKMLNLHGIKTHAITADERGFLITKKRLDDMGVPLTLVSENHRLNFIETNFGFQYTAFVGDGFYDSQCLSKCQIGYAPKNATEHAKNHADHIIPYNGGEGVLLYVALDILQRENYETNT